MRARASILLIAMFAILLPAAAQANAGVPMIFVVAPILGLAFVPIVVAEGAFMKVSLALDTSKAYAASILGNASSTFAGIPLTWGLLVSLQLVSGGGSAHGIETPFQRAIAVTWQGPWLIPYEGDLHWMVPSAALFLSIPFFLVSVWSERLVCTRFLHTLDRTLVRRAVLEANAITYVALVLFGLVWLFWSVRSAA